MRRKLIYKSLIINLSLISFNKIKKTVISYQIPYLVSFFFPFRHVNSEMNMEALVVTATFYTIMIGPANLNLNLIEG